MYWGDLLQLFSLSHVALSHAIELPPTIVQDSLKPGRYPGRLSGWDNIPPVRNSEMVSRRSKAHTLPRSKCSVRPLAGRSIPQFFSFRSGPTEDGEISTAMCGIDLQLRTFFSPTVHRFGLLRALELVSPTCSLCHLTLNVTLMAGVLAYDSRIMKNITNVHALRIKLRVASCL